jgi:hypothetical protein
MASMCCGSAVTASLPVFFGKDGAESDQSERSFAS